MMRLEAPQLQAHLLDNLNIPLMYMNLQYSDEKSSPDVQALFLRLFLFN